MSWCLAGGELVLGHWVQRFQLICNFGSDAMT